jgi:hypothetical protein
MERDGCGGAERGRGRANGNLRVITRKQLAEPRHRVILAIAGAWRNPDVTDHGRPELAALGLGINHPHTGQTWAPAEWARISRPRPGATPRGAGVAVVYAARLVAVDRRARFGGVSSGARRVGYATNRERRRRPIR